jgi:hypothetical protein
MGQTNQFGKLVHHVVIALQKDLLQEFLQMWEELKDGKVQGQMRGQEILIDKVLIHEQLGISKEGVVNVANATFDEANVVLRKIASPHAFVENEQCNVVRVKEEFHVRFVTILQMIYQRERLAYFNNKITITFDLVNKGQLVN